MSVQFIFDSSMETASHLAMSVPGPVTAEGTFNRTHVVAAAPCEAPILLIRPNVLTILAQWGSFSRDAFNNTPYEDRSTTQRSAPYAMTALTGGTLHTLLLVPATDPVFDLDYSKRYPKLCVMLLSALTGTQYEGDRTAIADTMRTVFRIPVKSSVREPDA